MNKKNWFVIATCHAKYSFETLFHFFKDMTIKEVIDKLILENSEVDEVVKENVYEVDLCGRIPLTKERYGDSYPEIKDMTGLAYIHLDATLIVAEDYVKENESVFQCWGSSGSKFGLLDYCRKEEQE